MPFTTILHARQTRRSHCKFVGSPDTGDRTTPLCPRTPILSQGGGEINMGQRVGGGKPGIAYSLVGGGAVEWIDSGEMLNEGFGLIRVAAEEHVGDDG